MTVYPDGEALSDWECHILQDIEQDMEGSDPRLAAFLAHGDPAPLYALATCLVAAEAAAASHGPHRADRLDGRHDGGLGDDRCFALGCVAFTGRFYSIA